MADAEPMLRVANSKVEVLRDNLATLGATQGQVVTADAQALLEKPSQPADLVLLDPPFHQGLAASCCAALEAGGWLASDAMIYLETEQSLTPAVPANWNLHRETQAGESIARLYQRVPS